MDLLSLSPAWPLWAQLLVAALLVLGGAFLLIGALGMLRFGDFFMRLHAPTKATTLGVGGVLLAGLVVGWLQGHWGLQGLLITLLLFITAPVSANLMAQAALHRRARSTAPLPHNLDPASPAKPPLPPPQPPLP